MNVRQSRNVNFGCLFVLAVIGLVVAYKSTGSLNPMEVYQTGGLAAKIVVSALAAFVAIAFAAIMFNLIAQAMIVAQIRLSLIGKDVDPKDLNCPSSKVCMGKNLLKFMGPYGFPVQCLPGREWWHQQCFTQEGGTMLKGCPNHQQQIESPFDGSFDQVDLDGRPRGSLR